MDNPGDGIEELAVLAELQAMFERLTDVEPSIEVADTPTPVRPVRRSR